MQSWKLKLNDSELYQITTHPTKLLALGEA